MARRKYGNALREEERQLRGELIEFLNTKNEIPLVIKPTMLDLMKSPPGLLLLDAVDWAYFLKYSDACKPFELLFELHGSAMCDQYSGIPSYWPGNAMKKTIRVHREDPLKLWPIIDHLIHHYANERDGCPMLLWGACQAASPAVQDDLRSDMDVLVHCVREFETWCYHVRMRPASTRPGGEEALVSKEVAFFTKILEAIVERPLEGRDSMAMNYVQMKLDDLVPDDQEPYDLIGAAWRSINVETANNAKRKRDIADAMGALDEISNNPNIPENVYRLLANGLKARHDEVGEVAGLWRIDE